MNSDLDFQTGDRLIIKTNQISNFYLHNFSNSKINDIENYYVSMGHISSELEMLINEKHNVFIEKMNKYTCRYRYKVYSIIDGKYYCYYCRSLMTIDGYFKADIKYRRCNNIDKLLSI